MRDESKTAQLEAELHRHRLWAGGLLVATAAVWLASHVLDLGPEARGWVRAFTEAGMVGGLADWFAVTALFRRPLGLPIPHTALVPSNRERIAQGIARYVGSEFLQREMLVAQLRRLDLAGRLAGLLEQPHYRGLVVDGVMRFLPRLVRGRQDELREAITTALRVGLQETDLRPALARMLASTVASDDMGQLIRAACDGGARLLEARRQDIQAAVDRGSSWYIPGFLDRKIADALIDGLKEHLERLKDPASKEGQGLRAWLDTVPAQVTAAGGENPFATLIQRMVEHRALVDLLGDLWGELRRMLEEDLRAPESRMRRIVESVVGSLADQMDSVSLRREINGKIELLFVESLPQWREEIERFFERTLREQEVGAFTRSIELRVGKDLQYVRINGTVLGMLIGGSLHALHRFVLQ